MTFAIGTRVRVTPREDLGSLAYASIRAGITGEVISRHDDRRGTYYTLSLDNGQRFAGEIDLYELDLSAISLFDADLDELLSTDEDNHDTTTYAGNLISVAAPVVEPYSPRTTRSAMVGDRIRITVDTGGSAVGTEHTVTRVVPEDTTGWDNPGAYYSDRGSYREDIRGSYREEIQWHANFDSFELVDTTPPTPEQLKLLLKSKLDAYHGAPDTLAKKVVIEELEWVLTLLA